MKKFLFAAGCFLLLASCSGSGQKAALPGYWLEVMPVNREYTQGIYLAEDGGAASIGMHTLRYERWERQGDRLVLRGQSIGNGQTILFSDTLDIVRLDADTLTLEKFGKYRIEYTRADFRGPDGVSVLDSLAVPSPTSVLDVRTFGGVVPSPAGDVPSSVTLYTYDNCGDGVYLHAATSVSGDVYLRAGRMYTLRGDVSDQDAVVYELKPFDGRASSYFRFLGDRLEPLDATLAPVGADGTYTLMRR